MPTKVKGCRSCSRRRINCDRTLPACNKCVRDNLVCYGLSGTYRWLTSRTSRKTRTPGQGSKRDSPPPSQMALDDSDKGSLIPLLASPTSPLTFPLPRTQPSNHEDQWVLNYFAEQITPWMCPILREDNECKMQVLPLAASSPLVFNAVAATSFHRLAYYGNNEFASKAERYRATAIKGLLESCQRVCLPLPSSQDVLFAAATLLILMYDEMVAAQGSFTTLARVMSSMRNFVDFSTLSGSSELQRYLSGQFDMLAIFALPHLDEGPSQTHAFELVDTFESTTKEDQNNPPFLADCWKTVLTAWLCQKQNSDVDVVNSLLEDLKFRILSHDGITRFDHYMTWVYFMAAAASPSPHLRSFFRDRLFQHTITFGWKNVALMLKLLEELEKSGSDWPSRLQSHKKYICV
ncbi:hypothetical protein VE01_02201 [Pseudogymnoascus verrucosus]|uniref:Zn(2)-C6 fungal-type domain-containing protein n=1 Tax=Pseudogymnoascus verrucosus TaxID=342668 RepID=A0A1B8GVQ7_9PEZI|nr:uncharacterized protein VE01_02201 [Pseudogymnoascus verrucosus]OBT99909.1 hypothetical protein VE01_02201 [Pseudogymnoascus verrucosus]